MTQWQQPPRPQYGYPPQAPGRPKRTRQQRANRWAWIAAGAVVLVAAIVIFGHAAAEPKAPTYRDASYLAQSLQQQVNADLAKAGSKLTASGTVCVLDAGNDYRCVVDYSDQSSDSYVVTVAGDGQSWVSHRDSS